MFETSSQMREFVNFAQDAVANNAKNSIARLGKQESRYSAFAISAATDGDSVGKLRRSAASNGAKNLGQGVLKSISERSTSYEIAKAFADVFAKFRKLMSDGNYNDQFDRAERNAYLLLFAGVAMAGLNQGEKEHMAMIFAKELAAFADTLAEWQESPWPQMWKTGRVRRSRRTART